MISVVAPNLNDAKHLKRFLSSLEHQSFKDFEVVIVDGGSKDDSFKIIEQFQDRLYIRLVVYLRPNLGEVRNVGATFSLGDIIVQTNSDNVFPSRFLEKLFSTYKKNPKLVSVAGRVQPIGDTVICQIAYTAFDFVRCFCSRLPFAIRKYCPSGSFTSYTYEAYQKSGGYPEVPVNEDGLFGLRLQRLGEVVFTLKLGVGHHIKKFKQMGNLQALLFYLYVFENYLPFLTSLFNSMREYAGLVFQHQIKAVPLHKLLWNWL